MTLTLSAGDPDELVAAVPHLLGFKPEESIVFLPLASNLPVARVDLPITARDRDTVWDSIRGPLSRYAQPGDTACIACFTADREVAADVAYDFSARLATIGINAAVRVWADDEHWGDLDSGATGVQTATARERYATETASYGRTQPVASRQALEASLVGDRGPVAALLPGVQEAANDRNPRAEGRWALDRLQQFHRDGVRLSDDDAARLLVAVGSLPIRDLLWADMEHGTAGSHVSLWTDLTSRAPDEVRAAPASMLGFASWLSGDGAMARCALDQVPGDEPYALASLVWAAVEGGVNPREWTEGRSGSSERGTGRGASMAAEAPRPPDAPARSAYGI